MTYLTGTKLDRIWRQSNNLAIIYETTSIREPSLHPYIDHQTLSHRTPCPASQDALGHPVLLYGYHHIALPGGDTRHRATHGPVNHPARCHRLHLSLRWAARIPSASAPWNVLTAPARNASDAGRPVKLTPPARDSRAPTHTQRCRLHVHRTARCTCRHWRFGGGGDIEQMPPQRPKIMKMCRSLHIKKTEHNFKIRFV